MIASDLPEETKQQIAALIFSSVNKVTLTFQFNGNKIAVVVASLLLLLLHLFVLDLIQVP